MSVVSSKKRLISLLNEVLQHSSDEASSQLFTMMIKLMRALEMRKSRKLLRFIARQKLEKTDSCRQTERNL